jgi:hypothetical protein
MGKEKDFSAKEYMAKILMTNITQLENSVEEVQVLDESQQNEVIKAMEEHLFAIDEDIKNYKSKVAQFVLKQDPTKKEVEEFQKNYPALKIYLESNKTTKDLLEKNKNLKNFLESKDNDLNKLKNYAYVRLIFTQYAKDKVYKQLLDNRIEETEKLNAIKQKVQDLKDKKEELIKVLNSENSEDTKENLEKIKKENLKKIKELYKDKSQFYQDQFSKIILEEILIKNNLKYS